jgi:pilus assembly protein Flp/PilA
MRSRYVTILKNQQGQGLTEYGLIIALIAIVCIGALIFLGPKIAAKFFDVGNEIEQAKPATNGGGL